MNNYAKNKIKLLNDFNIKLTPNEKAKIYNANSEYEIDRIARDFLKPLQ